jgi:hypothetical protein
MVAGREHMRAQVEKLIGYARGDSKTTRRIFGVDHDEIDIPLLYKGTKVFADDTSSRLAKNVTNKKNTQKWSSVDGQKANDPATGTKYFPK